MTKKLLMALLVFTLLSVYSDRNAAAQDARAVVEANFNYMRDKASVCTVEMTIHRPDWERTSTIKSWTKGTKDSLFVIIAPARDKGNGTLKKGREMWTFNPKINRVIKLPPSMMSQAWMGSDFSNNDLSKTDSVIHDYVHTIKGTGTHDGKKVYQIKSVPKPDAPVVWGMQEFEIREDNIPLSQKFYDEDLELVKALTFSDIKILGGKLYPRQMKMQKADTPDEYTLVEYDELEFKDNLPDSFFTLSSLKNPRR
ncbi:outer membrane lipoprotein-sorting protein [Desulfococcaceae bacterium HSG8]|nr:outer membrane lipoprotein-sorting protein [Desulfococcaceae bacterium HSG8]